MSNYGKFSFEEMFAGCLIGTVILAQLAAVVAVTWVIVHFLAKIW